jgi:hypothetical protein
MSSGNGSSNDENGGREGMQDWLSPFSGPGWRRRSPDSAGRAFGREQSSEFLSLPWAEREDEEPEATAEDVAQSAERIERDWEAEGEEELEEGLIHLELDQLDSASDEYEAAVGEHALEEASEDENPWGETIAEEHPWGETVTDEQPWGETVVDEHPWGEASEEYAAEEREYPHAQIVPEVSGEASEEFEENWSPEMEELQSSGSPLRVRILWPALGFPAVIAPREKSARGGVGGDATQRVTLLLLSNRPTLTKEEVAKHLRYVTWDKRFIRHIPDTATTGKFPAEQIWVRADTKSDPISLPTPKNRLISIVGFGGGSGEKSAILGGLADAVRRFYATLPADTRLPYLYEIRVTEDGSNVIPDGQYHLFWNNSAQTQDAPSDEMRLLIDQYAHPLRQQKVEGYDKPELQKHLLREYEYEYGVLHAPYQQTYPQQKLRLPRAEVLHPLFVQRKRQEPLKIGHLTDTHVDVRADVYEANLEAAMKFVPKKDYLDLFNKGWAALTKLLVREKRSPKPWAKKADATKLAELSKLPVDMVMSIAARLKLSKLWRPGSYNNLNRSFRDNYTKSKAESNIILLTGDLIDYGRGHYGLTARDRLQENSAYHHDRNWFLFYYLLAGDESYTVPTYTTLGNHDWRVNPYPPFAIAGAPSVDSILNNAEEFVPEYKKWLLQIAHGPGHERAFSYVSTAVGTLDLVDKDPAEALKTVGKLAINTKRLNIKGAPTETTIESVLWYLLTINPFLDYSFAHPSGQKILMLDWAEAEDVLFDIIEKGKARPYLPHEAAEAADGGPMAGDCLTPAQQKLVTNFVARPGKSKIVGIHAPPIAPWYDWSDAELRASKKTFHKDDKRRGPDIVSTPPNGGKRKWNGHPFFAIRPERAFHGMDANYNSIVKWRDEFINLLVTPTSGVRAVFAGHIHRDGLYTLWKMTAQSGPQTAGTLRVRGVAAPLSNVKPGTILGPLWVNTSSAAFRSNVVPVQRGHRYMPPGRALVALASDGTIQRAEFRRLPGIDKRVTAPAVPLSRPEVGLPTG